jgi:hypothetical protein
MYGRSIEEERDGVCGLFLSPLFLSFNGRSDCGSRIGDVATSTANTRNTWSTSKCAQGSCL